MTQVSAALVRVDDVRKAVRAVAGAQVQSKELCESLNQLAQSYYSEVRAALPADRDEVKAADAVFSQLHELSRKKPSKQKCIELLTEAKRLLVALEGAAIVHASTRGSGSRSAIDERIISTLQQLCPAAGAAYAQGIKDLESVERVSWRGPATELRESLRETLDSQAPDKEVEVAPWYKPEQGQQRPTMRQKVKYIFKNRDMNSSQVAHVEGVVQSVEDMVGGITRNVYTRSSVSTHTPTSRDEVLRVHAWVRLTLCELLAIPLE